jgi:hypothetical protein
LAFQLVEESSPFGSAKISLIHGSFDNGIEDWLDHPERSRAMAMSRIHSSIRSAKRNRPVEAVEKLPDLLPVSPLTILCPYCATRPGRVCATAAGVKLEIVHVARIKAAAAMDAKAKKGYGKRKQVTG